MNEIINEVTIEEMGRRFAQIRKKLHIKQDQIAEMLHSSQKRMSAMENGENTMSATFLRAILFYLQHVSAEMLFAKKFDIDDPHLFDKDFVSSSIAKARLQLFKQEMKEEMDEKIEDWGKRIDSMADYV